ncbi:MAG: metallopeptidase TldD-related protein [Myxococcota bacterium]|nr:metallopeptidase TldD-related protein [Myxococcota bacterium]
MSDDRPIGVEISEFGRHAGAAALGASNHEGLAYFANFGVTDRLISDAITRALSRGGDWAELYFEHRIGHHVGLEDGAVNRAYSSVSLGVGIRVIRDDQTGYAYTEDLSRASVLDAASTAAVVADGPARLGPKVWHAMQRPDRYRIEREWSDVGLNEKMPVLHRINERAFEQDSRIVKVRVGFANHASAILICDSDGRINFDRQPMTRISVGCTAEANGQLESNGHNMAGRSGFDFYSPERIDAVTDEAVRRTTFLFDATPAPAGSLPIVLAAGSSGILLHEAIGHGMEADFNRKNVSVYSEKLNKRIAPDEVTIVDDGTQLHARGSINIDDEGMLGQRTTLVEHGMLRTYMHDRISAQHYGVECTGNGRRQSFRHPPLPRMRNTYMLPGPHEPEDIIKSVDFGIYAETFTNGQVMIGAGDFTFYIKTGYLIENGRLTRPIKDTNIIGNGPEVLENTDMVGNDFKLDEGGWVCGKDGQSVPVSLGMPSCRVSAITVGGVNPNES